MLVTRGIAVAIAKTDTKQAVALLDAVGGPAFDHELARTAIAYKIGADRPDEAIKIIEGINRNRGGPLSFGPRRSAGWLWPWRRATGREPSG